MSAPTPTETQSGECHSTGILFAHALGLCKEAWDPCVSELEAMSFGHSRIHTHTFDFFGHGSRSKEFGAIGNTSTQFRNIPSVAKDWPAHALADVLSQVDEHFDPTTTLRIGVGHSFGGAALLLAELLYPGTFHHLVLVEPVVSLSRSTGPLLESDALPGRHRWATLNVETLQALRKFDAELACSAVDQHAGGTDQGQDDQLAQAHLQMAFSKRVEKRRTRFESRAVAQRHMSKTPMFSGVAPEITKHVVDGTLCDAGDSTEDVELACAPLLEGRILRSMPVLTSELLGRLGCSTTIVSGSKSQFVPCPTVPESILNYTTRRHDIGSAPSGGAETNEDVPVTTSINYYGLLARFLSGKVVSAVGGDHAGAAGTADASARSAGSGSADSRSGSEGNAGADIDSGRTGDCRHRIIDDATHAVPLEQPLAVARIVAKAILFEQGRGDVGDAAGANSRL